MNIIPALILVLILTLSTGLVANPKSGDEASQYESSLKSAIEMLGSKQEPPKITERMDSLVKLAKPMLSRFAESHPECKAYLSKALAEADKMPSMTLEQIERDYHADAALPKAPGLCHHAKDLLVHPITVLILFKSNAPEKYAKATAELAELNSHLSVVRQTSSAK